MEILPEQPGRRSAVSGVEDGLARHLLGLERCQGRRILALHISKWPSQSGGEGRMELPSIASCEVLHGLHAQIWCWQDNKADIMSPVCCHNVQWWRCSTGKGAQLK